MTDGQPYPGSGRWWAAERGDGGGAALTWVLLFPTVLLLLFGGIQLAITSYAKNLALATAQAGVRAATSAPGDVSRAAPAAATFATDKASGTLDNPGISVSVEGNTVTVTVTAQSQSVVPGMDMTVTQSASGPMERQS
ncbi:MAG TPA: TadE/TadG family type IV pilus assembly protein [Mycobacterium sp.]